MASCFAFKQNGGVQENNSDWTHAETAAKKRFRNLPRAIAIVCHESSVMNIILSSRFCSKGQFLPPTLPFLPPLVTSLKPAFGGWANRHPNWKHGPAWKARTEPANQSALLMQPHHCSARHRSAIGCRSQGQKCKAGWRRNLTPSLLGIAGVGRVAWDQRSREAAGSETWGGLRVFSICPGAQ